jgi:ABC-2 type transport system permease protein
MLALLLQIAQLLPLPVVARVALPSYAFIAWRGLFTNPAQTGPLVVGAAVSLAFAVAASALAYRLFTRRDFTDPEFVPPSRKRNCGRAPPATRAVAWSRMWDRETTAGAS